MFKIKEGLQLFNKQTTVRYPSGNYGSFEIDGGAKGGYEGYSIGGRVTFMHANNSEWGIYNDVNNQWAVRGWFNGSVDLFYAGSEVVKTTDRGLDLKNNGILQFGTGHSYKISSIQNLQAVGTQAKRYEIARLGIDFNDWNSVGTLQVELHEKYYDKGLIKKYHVYYGYTSNKGVQLYEMTGTGTNNMRVTVGDEVVVSGDHRYVPVYVDVRYYTNCTAVIKSTKSITSSTTPSIGSMWLASSPAGVNISNFTADSEVFNNYYNRFASGLRSEGTLRASANAEVYGDLKMQGSDSFIWTPNSSAGYTGFWDQRNARLAMKYRNDYAGWGVMGEPESGTALKVHGTFKTTGNSYLGDGNGDTTHINDKLFVEATDSGDAELRVGEDSSGGYGLRFHWDSGHNGYFKSRHAGTDNNFLSFDTRYTHKLKLYRALERTAHSNGYFIGSYNSVGDNATKTNPIYTIGDAYRPSDSSLGNMYGIGYCADGAGFISGQADSNNEGWGQYIAADGDARIFLGGSKGNIYAKGYNSYFGESGNWNSATAMTRIHPQGHNQFWFGAGNGTWFTGTANSTSRHDDLCTGESSRHDTLITTMQGDSNTSRGITFAVANNSAGTSGYRIGRWFAGDNSQANSILVVDGQLFAKAGNGDEFDHYANNYDSYRGTTNWGGDQAWHKPGVVSARALQIQSGNANTSSHKPQLQFHQNGYGGVKIEYNGPSDVLHISGASNRLDHVQIDTHGYTNGLRINYDQVWSPSRPLHIQHSSSENTYINCSSGGRVGIGSDSADEKLHVHGNTKVTGDVYGNLIGQNNRITVGGDANTYYPVILSVNSTARVQEFHIYRGYSDTAPNTWNTSTHKGGLSLKFDIRNGSWGGYTNDLTVYYFGESYSRIVGGIVPVNHTMQFCVWLRGGGAAYHIQSDQHFGCTVYDNTSSNYYSGQGWLTYNNANNSYDSYTNYKTQAQADASCKDTIYRRMIRHGDGSLPYITSAPRYEDMSLDGITYLEVGNNQTSVYNDGGWHGRLNVAGQSHARIDTKCVSDGIITSMFAHTGHGQGKIGTYSNHTLGLMVNGSTKATLNSSGAFTATGNVAAYSDSRVKTNVQRIPDALEKVSKLNGYTFDRTDLDVDADKRQTGVIAQEVLQVLPEAVMGSEEDHYSVAYGNMVGLLIEAIKEQQVQIEELKTQVNNLKGA